MADGLQYSEPPSDSSSRRVWEVMVWDPDLFKLYFFCFFSPAHLFTLHLLARNFTACVGLSFLTSVQLYILVSFSQQQSKDKSLINGQVFKEYNTKFVDPHISVSKRDVMTSTNAEDDQAKHYLFSYSPRRSSASSDLRKFIARKKE